MQKLCDRELGPVQVKTQEELEIMRYACKVASAAHVQVGLRGDLHAALAHGCCIVHG